MFHRLPSDWHPQDWILIIEALALLAGPHHGTDPRGERAYQLIDDIAAREGLSPAELLRQSSDEYFDTMIQ